MFYRNLTSVRYLAAQSATLIPVPYENTLRQFMAQRLTLQRNNVEIFTQDLQHPGIQPITPSPNHLDISRLSWTTLPQSAKNVNKLKPSRKRNQWYVHICFTNQTRHLVWSISFPDYLLSCFEISHHPWLSHGWQQVTDAPYMWTFFRWQVNICRLHRSQKGGHSPGLFCQ